MIERLLIANRGEIVARIARTCRRMGIETLAVHSQIDSGASFLEAVDKPLALKADDPALGYLDAHQIVDLAVAEGAQAIHPGYGFLAENAEFAALTRSAGLIFVGPGEEAIRLMGSKAESKAFLAARELPVIPGYQGEADDIGRLCDEASKLGFPLLVKASAGGGGKGMRILADESSLAEGLEAARREAEAAFGDGRLILERYLPDPRHIEVQVFRDRAGNTVHLFERDCSLQRRHQKVIEEAPAPDLDPSLREALFSSACAIADAVDYEGAGTVEFLVADGSHYFMEMNTRLQVEHPVTEMVTGLDLVEWQLRIAQGEALPCRQSEITCHGHAFEARLYAEDVRRGFLPAAGALWMLDYPAPMDELRIESGVREGEAVSPFYDPMIAKIVAWGDSRIAAMQALEKALRQTRVMGLESNRDFLIALLCDESVRQARLSTAFIEARESPWLASPPSLKLPLSLCALAKVLRADKGQAPGDPYSPWAMGDAWRLNSDSRFYLRWDGSEEGEIVVTLQRGAGDDHWRAQIGNADSEEGEALELLGVEDDGERINAQVGEATVDAVVLIEGDRVAYGDDRVSFLLGPPKSLRRQEGAGWGLGDLHAPLSGRLVKVLVAQGDLVAAGEPLALIEAMKMEHPIKAPEAARVAVVHCQEGAQVREGETLLRLEASSG